MKFTQLHVHTCYSLLDGLLHLEEMIKFAKENNLTHLAVTEHDWRPYIGIYPVACS